MTTPQDIQAALDEMIDGRAGVGDWFLKHKETIRYALQSHTDAVQNIPATSYAADSSGTNASMGLHAAPDDDQDGGVSSGKPCTVHIKHNKSGEIREIICDWYDDYDWSEGNYSCDCNRHRLFLKAKKEEIQDDPKCGDGAYAIVKIVCDNEIVYKE